MLVREFAAQVKHLACDRRECGNCSLCHMPITLSRRQLARVAFEFVVVEPDCWLCVPYILGGGDDLFTHVSGIPVAVPNPQGMERSTLFETLVELEQKGAFCGAVDVQYTTEGQVYVAYLYWSAGMAIVVVTCYTILTGSVVTVQVFDTSKALESFVKVWRKYAQVPQTDADQVSQVLFGRV